MVLAEDRALFLRWQIGRKLLRDLFERGLDPIATGHPALCHVFAAASATAESSHSLFQQRAHVEGLAGRLREYQRRLR